MNHPVSPLSGQEPLEIERKFLIEYPDLSWLRQQPGSRRAEIVQTYLLSDGNSTRRVRSWTEAGRTSYIRTCKRAVSDRTRVEVEDELSEADYLALLKEADPTRHPVEKTRWCIPCGDQAVLEVELQSEEEEFLLPPEIRVIREVTGDPRYLNSSLARELP